MSKNRNVFDLLRSAGKKRARPSKDADKEGDAPRKKQEQAQVKALTHLKIVLRG